MKERVLIEINNIRLVTPDSYNVKIERLEKVFDTSTNQYSHHWQFEGYFRSILGALDKILTKESWLDKNTVTGLQTCYNEVLNFKRNFLLQ